MMFIKRTDDVRRLPWPVRRRFYQQTANKLKNGRAITHILRDAESSLNDSNRKTEAKAIGLIHQRMVNGTTLTKAMGDSLTDLERGILSAGEETGDLAEAMWLILEVREMTTRLRRKMQTSFFSPVVYFFALYATLYTLGHFVTPSLAQTVPVEQWTGWGYTLYVMGLVSTGWYAPAFLLMVAGAVIAVARSLPTWTGKTNQRRNFCDRYFLPYVVYREINGFAWLLSFAALLKAGLADTAALKIQMAYAPPWLESRLVPIYTGIKNGLPIQDAMRTSGAGFPSDDLIQEIGEYSGFPDFAEKIEAVARQYAAELERSLLLRGTMISALFGGLMYFAFAVLQMGGNTISGMVSTSLGS